jgi:hypothetical protein
MQSLAKFRYSFAKFCISFAKFCKICRSLSKFVEVLQSSATSSFSAVLWPATEDLQRKIAAFSIEIAIIIGSRKKKSERTNQTLRGYRNLRLILLQWRQQRFFQPCDETPVSVVTILLVYSYSRQDL